MAKKRANRGPKVEESHHGSTHKLMKLSKGHAIENFIEMRAYCGARTFQWVYGTERDVQCEGCRTVISEST